MNFLMCAISARRHMSIHGMSTAAGPLTILLLGVGLHLVGLVFGLGSLVGCFAEVSIHVLQTENGKRTRVVTTVVDELLVQGEIHNVGTDGVHEILRMRSDDKNMVVP